MKLLYLSFHSPFNPAKVATGNQVRCAGISAALQAAGHEIVLISKASSATDTRSVVYNTAQDLSRIIQASKPDAIIVGYWSLLADLPEQINSLVVLDFIAPRLLEAMYQEEGVLLQESRQILSLLPRVDHFLVGNQKQSDLLLSLLLLSGFDCKDVLPVTVLPISTSGICGSVLSTAKPFKLVSAGVDWPWRQSQDYIAAVEQFCAENADFSFSNITGSYPGAKLAQESGLLSYSAMQKLLADSDIGLEVGRRNTEREFSHSFRVIEYLQCGLPVIVNSWLPVAERIRQYDAGWLVENPEQLLAVLKELQSNPQMLTEKTDGAVKLANSDLNYAETCKPFLSYLASPWRPVKSSLNQFQSKSVVSQPEPAKAPGRFTSFFSSVYKVVFCRRRPENTNAVLMVTRSDLFPVDHGAAVKIVRTAEALSRQGRDVYLCTDDRKEYRLFRQGKHQILKYPFWLRMLALPRGIALLRLLWQGYPMSNAFLYFPVTDASYIFRTLYLATKYPIGAYQAEFPAYVRPCRFGRKLFGGQVVLVQHNVEYLRLKAQIKGLSEQGFAKLKALELQMCNVADAVITVSDNDRHLLIQDGVEPAKLHTIPHGVDLTGLEQAVPVDVRSQYGIPAENLLLVYHGVYSYPPNLEAMEVMAQELLPRFAKAGLAVSVLAVGNMAPETSPHPAIHFTGSVADLGDVLPAADIAVVPLQEGGGTRMKILDYFAAGVPVISTGKGIEGIPVTDGQEAIIRDDFDAICAAVVDLSQHPEKAQEQVKKARAFVNSLSWDAIAKRYLPLLG